MRVYRHLLFCFFLGILLGFQACSPKITKPLPSKDSLPVLDTVVLKPKVQAPVMPEAKSLTDELNFNYLKAKSKVTQRTENDTETYTVDMRAKKDSIIWLNISVAGLSGATGIFTQKAVKIYEKINSRYLEIDYDSLSRMMGFSIDFELFQSLIVGNRPFSKKNARVIREQNNYIIQQEEGKIKIDNVLGENRRLKKLLMSDAPASNKLSMDFEDFTALNQFLFPYSSELTLDVEKNNRRVKTVISIKFSKVELLDEVLEFPFRVPEKLLKKKK